MTTTPDRVATEQLDTATSLNISDEVIVNNAGRTKKSPLSLVGEVLGTTDHIEDNSIHHVIDDAHTATNKLWSSAKIEAELENITGEVLGVQPVIKGGTGHDSLPDHSIFYSSESNTVDFLTLGAGLSVNAGVLNVKPGLIIEKRQTVLSGSIDANGHANFIAAGSGLSVNLSTTVPLTIAFAGGIGAYGSIDYIARSSAAVGINSLTASSTCYLYADLNNSTSLLTYGHSVLQPVYDTTAPSSPAVDQHWFNPSTMVMQRWTGTAWAQVLRVFIGECVTGSASVTGARSYALKAKTKVSFPSLNGFTGSNQALDHNLGLSDYEIKPSELLCLSNEANYSASSRVSGPSFGLSITKENANQISVTFGATLNAPDKNSGTGTSLTFANWGLNLYLSRGF